MMLNEPNIKLNELNRIKIPVVVLAGEKDIIKYKHSKLIADNIPNSILEIVNKENHGSYIIHSDKIYEIIKAGVIGIIKNNNEISPAIRCLF